MRRTAALSVLAATVAAALLAPTPALAGDHGGPPDARGRHTITQPTLVARATLSADYLAPGPPSGAQSTPANGRQGPFAGQVIPGFSGMVDAGDGTFWALPDNGFGAKTNSADFLLRLYHVTPQWQTASGGDGQIQVGEFVSLRDPDHRIDFPIVNDATPDRLLTGADFDVESVVRSKDGSFWIGEEFGPFLLHVDATGTLLAAPVPFPAAKSPQNPYLQPGETPRLKGSNGFEAMAGSRDGRFLYPVTEGAFVDDAVARRRTISEFDTGANGYTGRTWAYQTDQEANLVGDAFMTGKHEMLVVERDNFQGEAAVIKRVYRLDLDTADADGFVTKTLVLDALKIANPDHLGNGDGYGTDEPFSLPVQSFETVVQLRDGRLLIANDNNYPGNAARIAGTPDDTEMDIVDLRQVRAPSAAAVTVIGHRGGSGYRPEHTLASYETAIRMCADYIEPDLVSTKDGVLVARHENEIGGTTDVANHVEFADRKATKTVDGRSITGWFTEDFTLAELRTLRAKERLPLVRPANTAFDTLYEIPTFDEVLDLARHSTTCDGQPVGVYPETKHPTYFDSVGLSLEEPLLAQLAANGMDGRRSPVFIQSFETANLRQLHQQTRLPLVQLVDCSGAPYDLVASGDPRTYKDLVTRKGLAQVARYASGVGLCKDVMIPRNADGSLAAPTAVIADAHRVGLVVHGWTFRRENQFLPLEFRSSTDPNAVGDLAAEIRVFVGAGMDGVFSDNPDVASQTVG
ncbi:esterase-like activity of phytase family protein [Cellulomonas sp. URHE0023]|uniref:esterase-like activity of phytase family protein n=1 Tax=Cellulomonas sp. URHE0023 TaxID=1380354 RepID=UPI000553148F|nr:esterase-like activity of phytase family protein [Cellulomonas sp. URHE0023]